MPLLNEMIEKKLIVAVRGAFGDQAKCVTDALTEGGIRFIEFAYDQSMIDHSDMLAAIEYASSIKELCVGAGTTLTPKQVRMAQSAGARYIISPSLHKDVIAATKEAGLFSIPGALTPSEIATAYSYGADLVKLFPASALGASYINALRAPLGYIPLMAMGGIDKKNIMKYYAAGIKIFGVGSNIVNRDLIENNRYDEITARAKIYCTAVAGL